MSSDNILERELSLKQAALIVIAAIAVILILGFGIGYAFFWNQFDTTSKLDRDFKTAQSEVIKNPKNVMAHIKMGELYTRKNETNKALTEYKTAYDLSKKSKSKNDKYNAESNLAFGYISVKNYKEAIKILEPFVEEYPSHQPARYNLAYTYYNDGQYQKAVDMFKETLKLDSGMADGYYYLALSYEKLGNKEEALKNIEQALKFVPNYKEALEAKTRLSK